MDEVKIKKLDGSEIEIEGEIPFKDLEKHKEQALKTLGSNIKIDGFRKGHVPEKIIMGKIGEPALLNEMAQRALSENYPKIIIENKISPITHPDITITKIAMGNPLGFKIKVPVMPEVLLPDYKKIAEENRPGQEKFIATEEEEKNLINQVLQSKTVDGKTPKLTDDLVKKLGDFKNLKDFKERIRDGIKKEKEFRQKNKRRLEIIDKIVEETKVDLPDIITQSELDKMLAQIDEDVKRIGMDREKYLKSLGKTEEQVRVEWRTEAEKRGKTQLIVNKIAVQEKIFPKKKDIDHETKHILGHRPEANEDRVRIYSETLLTNEAVMKFLEELGAVDEEKK